jgi:ERCC4-type nuclease
MKHPNATVATYKSRRMKHLKHVSETLAKTIRKHFKTIANICNIQMKHSQQTYEIPETLETYACNMHVYATSRSTLATSR